MNPYEQYRKVSVMMSSPARLIVMLYDRAIQDLEIAAEAIANGDLLLKGERVLHAQEIITELMGALDVRSGNEISISLRSLYAYMIRRLIEANQSKDVSALEEIVRLLRELREGWEGAAQQETRGAVEGRNAAQEPAATTAARTS
ncbi:MAG: flagellar export chaperone FliS [Nitrospinota bacterium]